MKKRMMSVLLTLCMLVSIISAVPITASAATSSGMCGDNLTWTLDNNGTLTISGTGDMWDWNWNDSPWFNNIDVKNVVIKNGVTSIGGNAFSGFGNLTSISIPDSVICIESGAFSYCTALINIEVDSNNRNYSSVNGTLYDKNKNVLMQYAIGKKDTSFDVPNSVITIKEQAFEGCSSLTSINIPDSVTSIGKWAFGCCNSLTSINIQGRVTNIGGYTFSGCSSLTSIGIPNSVTSIEYYAFVDCSNLKDVYYYGS